MKNDYKKIEFKNENISGSYFDIVRLEDVFKKKPTTHSQFDFHQVTFYGILLFTQGEGTYNINFKDYPFKKGSLFTIRKDNIHKFYKSNANGILLIFKEDFIFNHTNKIEASKNILIFNELLSSPNVQLSKIEYNEIIILINQAVKEYLKVSDSHSPIIIECLFQIILTKLFRIKSNDLFTFQVNGYLPLFLDFQLLVENNCFGNRKVTFYANKMGITTRTLNNITNRIVHMSAKKFINELFIIKSKRLIINSKESLTEIAYKVGFGDPSNFFKHFIKYAGISPSSFKESLNG